MARLLTLPVAGLAACALTAGCAAPATSTAVRVNPSPSRLTPTTTSPTSASTVNPTAPATSAPAPAPAPALTPSSAAAPPPVTTQAPAAAPRPAAPAPPQITGPVQPMAPRDIPGDGVPVQYLPQTMLLPASVGSAPGYTDTTATDGIFYLTVRASLPDVQHFLAQAYPTTSWRSPKSEPYRDGDRSGFRFSARNTDDPHGLLGVIFTALPHGDGTVELQCQWAYVGYRG